MVVRACFSKMTLPRPQTEPRSRARDILRVASGNFLEMYDFMVFGYFAAAIGAAYFPSGDPLGTLLKSLATFGVGFLMRPLGAIILGSFTDRHGRRKGLLLTLALMSIGIVTLAVTPAYATIGVLAPVLILFGRLLQGFSAGAELGNVSVYLAEIAPPGRKGFYVSWQSASQQVAVVVAALVGVALSSVLGAEQLAAWGWRIPLVLGCAVVPFIFLLRRHLRESDEFERRGEKLSSREIARSLWAGRAAVLGGVALVLMTTVSFYMITAYTPTFGKLLHLPERDNLWVTAGVGASNLAWLPRIGRRPILIACTVLAVLTAYPAMTWLAHDPSIGKLITVELWLSAIYASYNSAMVVYLTEVVPPAVRASGFSLAYSLATAVGGFTPFIVTWLIGRTGNLAIPGAWLTAAALISLAAVLFAHRQQTALAPGVRGSGGQAAS
jgi:MHS family citrate/tricarballylate:H+ symporter-like MFS transporter